MEHVNAQFLLSFLIILLGYLCRRTNVVTASDGEGLARIIFNITLPALIITTFSTIQMDFSLILMTMFSLLYGLLMTAIGLYVFKKDDRRTRGMLSMVLPGFNIGLFAYPLVEAIWGQEGLKYFGMFDVGNSLVIFIVCYLIASHFSGEANRFTVRSAMNRLVRSIPLVTYVLVFCAAVADWKFPAFLLDMTQILAKANMPLSLLLLGMHLSFSFEADYWRNIWRILAIRYLCGLTIGGIIFYWLPVSDMIRYTCLIGFTLPVGMAAIPFAVEFGYDHQFVGTVANLTILISFLLIWGLIGLAY
jgi:predicted permease